MKRVLITGITGFIGSELARKLVNEGYEVWGLVRTTSNRSLLDPIKDLLDKIEIRYGNLTDFGTIRRIIKDASPHYIVHVGAATAVRNSFENPMEFQEANYLGTVNLIHSALDLLPEFKKFIFASTMESYGWQDQRVPFKEDLKQNPGSPYSVSKVACEKYIRMANKSFGLPYIISRACNTFGRKHNVGFVTEYVVTTMLKNETVYIGTPNNVRDMMYVDDHVNAYVQMIKSDIVNETFNFGTGNQMPMKNLTLKIKDIVGFKGDIVWSYPPDYPWRPVAEDYLSLDASKAKKLLGWEPKFNVEEGFKEIVKHWKNKIN